ncbi:MAG: ABC transporter permease, partial [Peptacetobacter hiranonis]|nr:ABC transporter permease [Peptacetobacter hiranonis]
SKLSIKYLTKNKSRTVMMFLGVIAAIALIFGLNTVKISQSMNKANALKKVYGSYHTEYVGITLDQLNKLMGDKDIASIDDVQNLGEIVTDNGLKTELKSFEGKYVSAPYYFSMKSQELVGRKARNNNEIVLDEEAAKIFGIKDKLGKEITVTLKKEYTDKNGKEQLFTEKKKFKVVGFVKRKYEDNIRGAVEVGAEMSRRIAYTYGNGSDELQGISFTKNQRIIPDEAVTYDSIVKFKTDKAKSFRESIAVGNKVEQVAMRNGIGRPTFYPNSNYIAELTEIQFSLENMYDKNNMIIILTVILLIFNIFNIMWGEIIREVSLLRLVGATKNKVRMMIIYQSAIIAVIGTILGILAGIVFSKVGLMVFKDSSLTALKIKPKLYVESGILVQTVVVSLISVVIATIPPIIKIGRVSSLNAVRDVSTYKRREKQGVFGRFLQKVFGIYGYMGMRNLTLKKSRTLISVISIALGGYMIMNTFTSMMGEIDNNITDIYYKYDIEATPGISNDIDTFGIDKKYVENLKGMKEVESVNARFEGEANVELKKGYANKRALKYYGIKETENIDLLSHMRFYTNDGIDERMKGYIKDGSLDSIKHTKDGYVNVAVLNYFYDPIDTHTYHEVIKGLKVGDIIPINVNYHNDNIERRTINVRVGALMSQSWLGYGDRLLPTRVEIITSENNMKAIFGKETFNNIGINLKDTNSETENKKVIEYVEDNIPASISNKFDFEEEQRLVEIEVRKEATISLILIVLISILNIFCTVRANLIVRRKEIFTMRALGMDVSGMKKMNRFEALTYGVLSSVVGIAIAVLSLLKMVKWHNDAYVNFGIEHFMDFTFPTGGALVFVITTISLFSRSFSSK